MTITLEQLKQKKTELEHKQTELEAMIKAYEEQAEAEFPKKNDVYYFLSSDGIVYKMEYANTVFNRGMLSLGNCFRTQEEAEFARERLKVIAKMKKCGGKIEYKRCSFEDKDFFISFLDDVISIHSVDSFWGDWKMWFPTKEAAQKAIDTIGEERLMKYWFCVEVEG